MINHIHILGASGSGTTTLGDALAQSLGYVHLDSDAFFWEPTDPPFQKTRDRSHRQALLASEFNTHPRWVLSGSLCGWGDIFIPRFDLVIFLYVPLEERIARINAREEQRFGREALDPGGAVHQAHSAFMDWAAAYDTGDENMRSLRRHEKWMAALPCPCIRLYGRLTIEEKLAGQDRHTILATVLPGLGNNGSPRTPKRSRRTRALHGPLPGMRTERLSEPSA